MGVDSAWLAAEFQQYEDIQPLGSGGQKEVFTARTSAGDVVVIKLFRVSANDERTARELKAMKGLSGGRIPKIIDSGVATSNIGQHSWFIEEYVKGHTLEARLQLGCLPVSDIRRWAEGLLSILVEAESKGIVHRDIKPANILLDEGNEAWLIDFGIARFLHIASVTATSAPFGPHSPGYAPPEQYTNMKQDVDTRSDLFGLGVVLYECLEGKNPYTLNALTADEVLRRVSSSDLPRITMREGVSGSFADLIQSMTRRLRSHRPLTARDALEWLRES